MQKLIGWRALTVRAARAMIGKAAVKYRPKVFPSG
jgi:hypothetical protein